MENKKDAKPMDSIVLLNDNYEHLGLKKGYVGTVVDNYIDTMDIILADFSNPITAKTIKCLVEIKTSDFKVLGQTKEDKDIVKNFNDLFL